MQMRRSEAIWRWASNIGQGDDSSALKMWWKMVCRTSLGRPLQSCSIGVDKTGMRMEWVRDANRRL